MKKNVIILVVGLILIAGSVKAQWSKDYVQVNQYRPNGQGIPGRGVTLGEYISGDLKVLAGSSENELVVKVSAFRAEGTYMNHEANKRDERAYLFCVFYKDDPSSGNPSDAKIKRLLIADCDQLQYEITSHQQISVQVPDHASYVIFTLARYHTSSANRAGYDGFIPGQNHLINECGYAPSGGELANFIVKRPYRPKAVRSAEKYEGITEDFAGKEVGLNGWDGPHIDDEYGYHYYYKGDREVVIVKSSGRRDMPVKWRVQAGEIDSYSHENINGITWYDFDEAKRVAEDYMRSH